MTEEQTLDKLISGDETTARAAFDDLCASRRGALEAQLRRYSSLNADDRADVIQTVFSRVWQMRRKIKNLGPNEWLAFLKKAAANCAIDFIRSNSRLMSVDEMDEYEVPPHERGIVTDMITTIVSAIDLGRLDRAADILWLGLPEECTRETHNRQLLAAQLFYLDNVAWTRVIRILGPGPEGEPAITRAVLDKWLSSHGVIRALAYSEIFYDNDAIVQALLGLPDDARSSTLDALSRDASLMTGANALEQATGGWTWAELAVILWRFRHALTPDQIAQRADCRLTEQQLSSLFDKIEVLLPFRSKMLQLLSCLLAKSVEIGPIKERGLWKRLAFEYCYREGLSHHDILQRAVPAATAVDAELTPQILNNWLSGGRLAAGLVAYIEKTYGKSGEDDMP